MIKLSDLLNESPAYQPAEQPGPKRDTEIAPGKPGTKPEPRRRSVPSPSTSPTPAPKAMFKESAIMDKIVKRFKSEFDKLHEVDYEKIFDPETVGKLKGSVSQRMQGKNPMQIAQNMQQLAMQVMQLEKGNEDLLEQLVYDIIYETYPYLETNSDVIEIDAKIVPQAQVKEALQPNSPEEEDIDDLDQEEEDQMMGDIEADLKKRRLINAITQGASTFSKSAD
jgi:hypothetical protein